jgi:NADH:ubiquinone oxidoreductase subunit 5 (subunit L)/multisubunit Na+/H+ antiporter MnhA subunit
VVHALAKSLLFLGAGAVLHRTGSRSLDRMGGLLTPMPVTGAAFLAGSATLSGVPPLGGFVGELLIYLAAIRCLSSPGAQAGPETIAVLIGLAFTGGVAAIVSAKAFGIAFLGHPRAPRSTPVREVGPWMRVPLGVLGAACLLAGPGALVLARFVLPAVAVSAESSPRDVLAVVAAPLGGAAIIASIVLAVALALFAVRRLLLARRPPERAVTWDCGYGAFTPRMQITGASFSRPLERLFAFVVRTRETMVPPQGHFPGVASLGAETPDVVRESVLGPSWRAITRWLSKARWIQHGHLNLYLLYIAVTLLVLLVWKLR